jgi:hypothetical protein
MRNAWADEFERGIRSAACADDRHRDCAHLAGFAAGLNPRRFRLEAGAMVCKCPCHASCPVATTRMAVQRDFWATSCICPGAEYERVIWKQERAERQVRDQLSQEAFEAVRAQAHGRTRQEVRDLYVAELRARSLPVPADDILDADAAAFTGNYLPGLTLLGRSLKDLASLVRHLG